MLRYLPIILVLAVWIYAFIDCLNTPEKDVRKLPKLAWVIIILLFGQVLLGPIAWFAVGRPRKNTPYGATRATERTWIAPDDNPDFLKSIKDGRKPEPPAEDSEATLAEREAEELSRLEEELRRDELRREEKQREEELRRKENGGPDDSPPSAP